MADVITRLKVESNEYDSKIKRAAQGLQHMEDACRKVGGTLAHLEKDQLEFVRGLGKMETVSKTARGRLGELTSAFTDLRAQYNRLTNEEKNGDFGRALNQSLGQLKVRIKDAKQELNDINKELQGGNGKFGQFGSIIDGIGQKMGINANITELLTSRTALLTGAIGVGTTAVVAATKAWADYNAEIAKQQQITTVTTGLKGDEADRMTAAARALSKTYNVDFREAINAANTLMSQFGKTGDESIQLLRDGMQGMIMGDGSKLLSMIQQYAPAFRDAGVSASQLVAVIQNSEGGIFTDQNMNAIVMGIKNIRLMTKATSDALAQLGIDGKAMTKSLNDGTITIFDALKQVMSQLQKVESGSQTAGEVMQRVFGRQGAASGTNLAKAIETLNLNLEETKQQTGDVGKAFDELYRANERLEKALQKTFGYKGWEEMATGIRTMLVSAMADVLEKVNKINTAFENNFGVSFFDAIFNAATNALGPMGKILQLIRDINKEKGNGGGSGNSELDDMFKYIKAGADRAEREKRYDNQIADINNQLAKIGEEKTRKNSDGSTSFYIDDPETQQRNRTRLLNQRTQLVLNRDKLLSGQSNQVTPVTPLTPQPTNPKSGSNTVKTEEQEIAESIKRLTQEYRKASDERQAAIRDEIKGLQEQLALLKQLDDEAQGKVAMPGKMETVSGSLSIQENPFEKYKNVAIDIVTPFDQFTERINYLKGIINPPNVKAYKMAREELEKTEKQFSEFKGDGKGTKSSNDLSKINQDVSKVASGIGGIFSGIQQMGIEIPQELQQMLGVLQGITTIMTAITTILSVIEATSTVTATTSTIKSVPLIGWALAGGGVVHAEGGWGGYVPGNHYSGDQIPALLNSGELVLNKFQQEALAGSLQGQSGGGKMEIVGVLTGENVVLMADRWGRRTGRGELLFGKNL